MPFPPVDKPEVYITVPIEEVRQCSPLPKNKCNENTKNPQSPDPTGFDLNGYYFPGQGTARSNATIPNITTSEVMASPSLPPDEAEFIPREGPIPGEAASQIAEADNRYNEEEIYR